MTEPERFYCWDCDRECDEETCDRCDGPAELILR